MMNIYIVDQNTPSKTMSIICFRLYHSNVHIHAPFQIAILPLFMTTVANRYCILIKFDVPQYRYVTMPYKFAAILKLRSNMRLFKCSKRVKYNVHPSY